MYIYIYIYTCTMCTWYMHDDREDSVSRAEGSFREKAEASELQKP